MAGKRAGMTEGTRSNLWGAMRTAIETIRPQYAVIENVRGLLSATAHSDSDMEQQPGFMGDEPNITLRALGRVLGDLADMRFNAEWYGLRAADIGAPHGRYRVFILATNTERMDRQQGLNSPGQSQILGLPNKPERCSGARHSPRPGPSTAGGRDTEWGEYEPTIRQWERTLGRVAPAPTQIAPNGRKRLSPVFVEWMMGLDEGHVTGIEGISRANQLKMLGNGVVPQQAYEALQRMKGDNHEPHCYPGKNPRRDQTAATTR